MEKKVHRTEEEWRAELAPEQYAVMRKKGTETPGSGALLHERGEGTYRCAACGNPLFPSDAKFDTSVPGLTGWPSFEEAFPGSVAFKPDDSDGMHRTEVTCAKCGAHLGHLFDDPAHETKTGTHYCINSVCLELERKKEDPG